MRRGGVGQVIYLIEGANLHREKGLTTAKFDTQIKLGFTVLATDSKTDTAALLIGLHRRLEIRAFPLENQLNHIEGNSVNRHHRSSLPEPPHGEHRLHSYSELVAAIELAREGGRGATGAVYKAMLKQVEGFDKRKIEAVVRDFPRVGDLVGVKKDKFEEIAMNRKVGVGRGRGKGNKIGVNAARNLVTVFSK